MQQVPGEEPEGNQAQDARSRPKPKPGETAELRG